MVRNTIISIEKAGYVTYITYNYTISKQHKTHDYQE